MQASLWLQWAAGNTDGWPWSHRRKEGSCLDRTSGDARVERACRSAWTGLLQTGVCQGSGRAFSQTLRAYCPVPGWPAPVRPHLPLSPPQGGFVALRDTIRVLSELLHKSAAHAHRPDGITRGYRPWCTTALKCWW